MEFIKTGIAGYGIVGKRRGQCIEKNKNMKMIAVCDRHFEKKGVMSDGVRYYSNYNDLLVEDLDALIVCMTNDIAAEVVMAGIDKGLHVFCEKPPGRSFEDILLIKDSYKDNENLKLMYGFNHRYHDSVKDAMEIIKSGKLGEIINLKGVYGKSKIITFNQSNWRTKRSIAGGGILLDQGIHMVDLMRLFAGEFTEIHSFISNKYWGFDVEDNAYALMRTKNGIVGMLHSSATQWRHRFNLDINLEKGSIILNGILTGTKSYGAETMTIITASPETDNGDPREQITRYNLDPSWDDEILYFSHSILNDNKIESGSVDDALKTMELVFKIYYSDLNWSKNFNIPDPERFSG